MAGDTQWLLGDTMGELMLWYGVADVCFIGGSLVPRGGQNPLEALCLDKPVLTGPHTANFDTLFRRLWEAHNEGGRDSRLRCLSIEEYRAHKAAGTAEGMAEARAAADGAAP